MGARTAQVARQVRSYTLCQLESCFGTWIPAACFPKMPAKENSRDRIYTGWRTFWCGLWQAFHPEASGREVVRQLQALFRLEEGPKISEEDSAYFRAKARLPLGEFPKALAAAARAADQLAPACPLLQSRPLKFADGTGITLLADTSKNRRAYPPAPCPQTPVFPILRLVVLFSALSGAILALAQGSLQNSELSLLSRLASDLSQGDILVGDRGFGYYPVIGWLKHWLNVDFIGRSTRRADGRRRRQRLGKNDWLVIWQKPARVCPWLSALQWAGLPSELTLRLIKGQCRQKGFRVRQVTLFTTLLDSKLYPAQDILRAYGRRWRLEMCLDDLKTTLKMETLRGRSPEMVQRDLYSRLIAHNLLRCLMSQTASERDVPLDRISFKGSLDTVRHFAQALARSRSKKKRLQLWADLLDILAADLVPERPERREPRAVKRKKNKYPRLNKPRHKFRDHPKRNTRRKNARLRKLGLM
jgi:hypothetical protein